MPKMQLANCLVALAGDAGTTVPKYGVTAAEIAVLRVIHGDDGVLDIYPCGEVERSHKAERARLAGIYARNINGQQRAPEVEALFPGAAARVFETIDELELDEVLFKPGARPSERPAEVSAEAPAEEHPRKRGRKPKVDPLKIDPPDDEDDGIGDMPDSVLS